jgi:hypothetical protein
MADQEFVVGYLAGDKSNYLKVKASNVTQYGEKDRICWKISGEKGTLWVSANAFFVCVPFRDAYPQVKRDK